ncbi:hypothetical protein [Lysinibacillus fusiformis]|uniref:hypothetical protein n=1 Tax=Lysinibacillus fusiformis TaxID=28031 RepID=UPI00046A6890|nr:hypothetical protein [Lysinibacillus fusiformis]
MDYKIIVEEKFGKSLKEIMHEVCVEKKLEKWEGAEFLGVPLKTFTAWRSKFRYGPMQMKADRAALKSSEAMEKYKNEIIEIDLSRPFEHEGNSLKAYKELIERSLELEKYKRTNKAVRTVSDIEITWKIGMLESILDSICQFESGKLYDQYMFEARYLK